MRIREASKQDLATIVRLVRESHRDVAVSFGLTSDNCPKHPSFCMQEWVEADFARGERYFILEDESQPVGCVAFERPSSDLAYLNRLSVLPEYRHRGIGSRLVEYIVELARASQVQSISIGVIGEHEELQRWYRKRGFADGDTKRFPHLPFSVKYMGYAL